MKDIIETLSTLLADTSLDKQVLGSCLVDLAPALLIELRSLRGEPAGVANEYTEENIPADQRELRDAIDKLLEGKRIPLILDVLVNMLAQIAVETGNDGVIVDAVRNTVLANQALPPEERS